MRVRTVLPLAREGQLTLSRRELAATLGIGLGTVHRLIREGKIVGLKVGKRTIFRADEPQRFLDALQKAGGAV